MLWSVCNCTFFGLLFNKNKNNLIIYLVLTHNFWFCFKKEETRTHECARTSRYLYDVIMTDGCFAELALAVGEGTPSNAMSEEKKEFPPGMHIYCSWIDAFAFIVRVYPDTSACSNSLLHPRTSASMSTPPACFAIFTILNHAATYPRRITPS